MDEQRPQVQEVELTDAQLAEVFGGLTEEQVEACPEAAAEFEAVVM